MVAESRLTELLMQWEERRLQGQTVAVEELCSDTPELLDELQRRIRVLEAMGPVLAVTSVVDGVTVTEGPPTDEQAQWPSVPGYEVLGVLGYGGMGVVYKVRNLAVDRVEALKMIRARGALDSYALQRFQQEIRATAQFEHARIVRIYAAGQHAGQPFFTMEYVCGGNLAQHMRRFSADAAAVALLVKVAQAVHYLHTRNIVHRDLKPANILLKEEHDEPLVSDFGLAKLFDDEIEPGGANRAGTDPRLTQAGAVMGTAAYMSPEQAAGQTDKLTAATDVWALGVMLYEMLTGRRPFEGKDSDSVREAVRTSTPVLPRHYRPQLGPDLEAICLRCLEKDPQRRYATAQALADDLERWQRGEPILPERLPRRVWRKVRRHSAISAIAAMFGALALVVAFLVPDYRPAEPPDKAAVAEANLKTALAEVVAGRRVELIPALGPPAAYRWASRGIHDTLSEAKDKPFSVNAADFALLELLPTHGVLHYRLSLQIHHEGGSKDGEVGIYFGYSKKETAQGLPIHCLCAISFNDITQIAGRPLKQGNDIRLNPQLLFPRTAGEVAAVRRRGPPGVSASFEPAGAVLGFWRTLEVDVMPDQVQVVWDTAPLRPMMRAQLAKSAQFLLTNSPVQPTEQPKFLPEEALGLYIFGATAWFRSCTIEALPDHQP